MRGRTPNNTYSVALVVPPLRPNSTAALFLPSSAVASSISPVAILITVTVFETSEALHSRHSQCRPPSDAPWLFPPGENAVRGFQR